jgi:hypothetical protein
VLCPVRSPIKTLDFFLQKLNSIIFQIINLLTVASLDRKHVTWCTGFLINKENCRCLSSEWNCKHLSRN